MKNVLTNSMASTWLGKKINLLNGCILTFDYGYTRKVNQNTLQSVRNHKYANPLENIGSTDISSHVNFKLIAEILQSNHLNVKKISFVKTDKSSPELASKKKSSRQIFDIRIKLKFSKYIFW